MPDTVTYESWSCDFVAALPKRSHFYHLQPLGVGDPQVESLTGYIARLAAAHDVSTGVFLTRELLPRIRQESDDLPLHRGHSRRYGFIYDAYVLNGISDCPAAWVRALEALTGQTALHLLTMLTWRRVISDLNLLRYNHAWCPYCLSSWRNAKLPIYEPLMWSMGCVSVCTIHLHSLEECCPQCQRRSTVLSAKAHPGYCRRCGAWLGRMPPSSQPAASEASDIEVSMAKAAGELLSLSAALPAQPPLSYFKQNLRRCVDEFAAGNRSHFARMTGTPIDSVHWWLDDTCHVRLDSFLRMCHRLQFSAARFLSEPIPNSDLEWTRARDIALQTPCRKPRRSPWYPELDGQPSTHAELSVSCRNATSVRESLERVLSEPAPRSLQSIAEGLGYRSGTGSLLLWAPDLCRAIVEKNRLWRQQQHERLRQEMIKCLGENPPLAMEQIAARLGHSTIALQTRFPTLFAALTVHARGRKLFEQEQIKERLQSALQVNPAPPMKEIGNTLGRHPSTLRVLFPELCDQIKLRYIQERNKVFLQRRLQFHIQIREAITDLRERGISLSRKKVFAAIINPCMRSTFILDQQIAKALHEFDDVRVTSMNKSRPVT
jgi:hypothetical protein